MLIETFFALNNIFLEKQVTKIVWERFVENNEHMLFKDIKFDFTKLCMYGIITTSLNEFIICI